MMKTSYIYEKPGQRESWFVDLTIYSIDDTAAAYAGPSTSKMRTRAHIYSDHAAQVNFSSHEYQILKAEDDIPGAHESPKPMIWTSPPIFTASTVHEDLEYPTPRRVDQSSSTPAKSNENRRSNGSLRKSLATTTPKSEVKREVTSTPQGSTREQRQGSVTLTPATATSEIDTTTPALAKLGKLVIEHLQSSGGAIRQFQNSEGAVQDPYETTTHSVSMSDSGGAVQSSKDARPKGNVRNKAKAPPPEPKRYGTRQRKSVERFDY